MATPTDPKARIIADPPRFVPRGHRTRGSHSSRHARRGAGRLVRAIRRIPRLSVPARFFAVLALMWRLARAPVLIGIGFAIGFVLPYAAWLDREVRGRFDDLSWEI